MVFSPDIGSLIAPSRHRSKQAVAAWLLPPFKEVKKRGEKSVHHPSIEALFSFVFIHPLKPPHPLSTWINGRCMTRRSGRKGEGSFHAHEDTPTLFYSHLLPFYFKTHYAFRSEGGGERNGLERFVGSAYHILPPFPHSAEYDSAKI